MSSDSWIRVSQRAPCPMCGKSDWCLVARDSTAAICARIESSKRCGTAGYLHRLKDDHVPGAQQSFRTIELLPSADWSHFASECRRFGVLELRTLANDLGVSESSLNRLQVGRLVRCWTFPHDDGFGRVCGVHLRTPDGRKPYVRGSRPGITVPIDIGACNPLIVTEGESDCAAALSRGFDAVARPGCGSSLLALMKFMRNRRPPSVEVFGDNDEAGRRGADELAAALARLCSSVRIVFSAFRFEGSARVAAPRRVATTRTRCHRRRDAYSSRAPN
jgi:hypothetical protein